MVFMIDNSYSVFITIEKINIMSGLYIEWLEHSHYTIFTIIIISGQEQYIFIKGIESRKL